MINVTPTAASKITELLTEENKLDAGLRVFVQGGGCSGFQYGLMIDEGEGDASTDAVIQSNGVKLLVDPISARYLRGAEVDFVDNVTGGGLTTKIRNPNPTAAAARPSACRESQGGGERFASDGTRRLSRQPSACRQQAIQQTRSDRQCFFAPGRPPHRRLPLRSI